MAGGEQGALGAGSLIARETCDVRTTSSLGAEMLLQYLTTGVTCLIPFPPLGLTLVICSALPLLTLVRALSQSIACTHLTSECSETATATTLASIATVKDFNAAPYERYSLDKVLDCLNDASMKPNWGTTCATVQFITMAMFVQDFWFGAKLVRDGKTGAGAVMAVFWACLITTSNLQMCILPFIMRAKGKFTVVSFLTLVEDSPSNTSTPTSALPVIWLHHIPQTHLTTLRKIIPPKTCGKLSLYLFRPPNKPLHPCPFGCPSTSPPANSPPSSARPVLACPPSCNACWGCTCWMIRIWGRTCVVASLVMKGYGIMRTMFLD